MKLHERSATLDVDISPQVARNSAPRTARTTQRFAPRGAPDAISKNRIQPAALAALLASASCAPQTSNTPVPQTTPPTLEQSTNALTIADLNPPPAPLVLPLANGATVRVSQRGNDNPSHHWASTQFAIDLATGGTALSPIDGTVRRNQGDCILPGNNNACPDQANCNHHWGAVTEIEALDGNLYIIAHCQSYNDAAPDGAFITKGTPVCTIGCTGNAEGVHPHFDRVQRDGASYTSLGVGGIITFEVGNTEPTVETSDTLETCCGNNCDARPGEAACKSYISFNRSGKDILGTFIQNAIPRDPRITGTVGSVNADGPSSNSEYTVAYQEVTARIGNQQQRGYVVAYGGAYFGTGNRNPFITTGYTYFYVPDVNIFEQINSHEVVHSQRYINFDLWDVTRSHLQNNERENLPFTQFTQEFPNWSPDWNLYGTMFRVNGRDISSYEAVSKNYAGVRYGIIFDNNRWSEWTLL